jgi:sugar phosphate isomerase/epimerase
MQLGFVSAILPDLTLDEVCAVAASEGYDCIEVMCWPVGKAERRYAGVTHIDVGVLGPNEVRAIRATLDKHSVGISALGYYPNPLSPDRDEAHTAVAHIKQVIRAAKKLGLANVNTFVGRDWTKSVDANWKPFLKTWTLLVRFAEKHGIRIGIENCPMLFSGYEWPGGKNLAISPAIWRRMFAEIPSEHFGLNYDPSHPAWMQMDPIAPLRDFADRIFHVHAKDVRVDRRRLNDVGILAHPLEFHEPKLPGLGDVDWGKFFSVLSSSGYDGPVCVEVEDRAYEGSLEARVRSLRQSARFLRQFVV